MVVRDAAGVPDAALPEQPFGERPPPGHVVARVENAGGRPAVASRSGGHAAPQRASPSEDRELTAEGLR
jgi:hypothetical protein